MIGSAPGPWKVCLGLPKKDAPNTVVPSWTTLVKLQAASSGKETLVTTVLAKWFTRDGKLVRGQEFEQFMADFSAAMRVSDPSYHALDAP